MKRKSDVYVIGAGGHAKVVLSTLRAGGFRVRACFDDDPGKWGHSLLGVPIQGPILSILDAPPGLAVIAIGDNVRRRHWSERLGIDWLTLVHPGACVDPTASLGPGTIVCAGAVVQPEVQIGAHAIVNTCASADHECEIGSYAHLGPGSRLAGAVRIEEGVLLGIGSAVISGVRIGAWATVGAGAAVVRDVPPDVVAVGVPARIIKSKAA